MAETVKGLTVKIDGDVGGLAGALGEISKKAQQVGKDLQGVGKKIQGVGDKIKPVSTAAAGLGAGLIGAAYKSVTLADDLNTLAKQTGFTTEEIQQMKYASDLVDVSFEDIAGALTKLKPKITEDNKALAELGVTTKNADGTTRDATEVFYDVLEALSQITNETERDQRAMEIFGRSANSLAGIIDDGGAAMKAYGQQAKDMGLILEQDTLDNLNQINDSIDQVKAQGGAALAQLGATLAQTLVPLIEKIVPIIEKISQAIAKLTPEQAELILTITGIVAVVGPLISMIGSITTGIGALMAVLSPTTLIIAAIAVAVAALAIVIIENWDKIKEWTIKTWNNITSSIKNSWDNIVNGAKNAWNNMKNAVTNAATNISNAVKNRWNDMKNSAANSFNAMVSNVSNTFNRIKTTISNIVDKLKNMFNFEWKLPKIKLPHFSWSWKDVGGLFKLPNIRVDWYRKAYENPYLFTSPTVMGGRGFGDGNGGEIVYGHEQLMKDIAAASTGEITINVYASDGMNVNQLADKVQQRLAQLQKQRMNAYA